MFNNFIKDKSAQANFLLMIILLACVFTGAYIAYWALFGSGMVAMVMQGTYETTVPLNDWDMGLIYEKWGSSLVVAATMLTFSFVIVLWYVLKKDTEERSVTRFR